MHNLRLHKAFRCKMPLSGRPLNANQYFLWRVRGPMLQMLSVRRRVVALGITMMSLFVCFGLLVPTTVYASDCYIVCYDIGEITFCWIIGEC